MDTQCYFAVFLDKLLESASTENSHFWGGWRRLGLDFHLLLPFASLAVMKFLVLAMEIREHLGRTCYALMDPFHRSLPFAILWFSSLFSF